MRLPGISADYKVPSEETHSRPPASCGIRSGGAVLHVVDQSILDIAFEYRFTVDEVQEYYDRCGAMDRTRTRFKKMREILSALPDDDGNPDTAA